MSETLVAPEFYPKQVVEIDVREGPMAGHYTAQITNLNDNAILVDVPLIGNLYLPLKIGQPMTLRYVVESWSYEAEVTIAARKDNAEAPLILVTRPKMMERKMLRKFLRVEANLEASVFLIADLSEYGREKFADHELTPALLLDISGGGARLRVPIHMHTDEKRYALLWFTLPIIHKSFYNLLSRLKTVTEDAKDKYLIVEFAGLSESERNDIVQFCGRRQLELAKTPAKAS